MEVQLSAVLPALRQMFPAMPDDILIAALEVNGNNVEDAIGPLLEMSVGSHESDGSALTDTTRSSSADEQRRHKPHDAHSQAERSKAQSKRPDVSSAGKTSVSPPATRNDTPPSNTASFTSPLPRDSHRNGRAPLPPPRTTWGRLGAEQLQSPQKHEPDKQPPLGVTTQHKPQTGVPRQGAAARPLQIGVKYVAPGGGASVRLGASDFPDLTLASAARRSPGHSAESNAGRGAPATLTEARSSKSLTLSYTADATLHDLETRTGGLSFSSEPGGFGRGGGCGAAATAFPARMYSGYAAAARRSRQPPSPHLDSWPGLSPPGSQSDGYENGAAGSAGTDEGWQTAALDELCRSHCWAGRELLEAVCLALQYDLTEVVAALDELNAASYQGDGIGSGGGGGGGRTESATSASRSASPSSQGDPDVEDAPRSGGGDSAAAAAVYDFPAQHICSGGRSASVDAIRSGGGRRRRCHGSESAAAASGGGDAYFRHRGAALKLTHAWRKRMSRASAAFAAGDRALGRRLVSEAQELRRQAAEAHQQAAEQIERENNPGRSLSEWELDLHGLHADEAVEALAKRIARLEAASYNSNSTSPAPPPPPAPGRPRNVTAACLSNGGSIRTRHPQLPPEAPAVATAAACDTTAAAAAASGAATTAATAKLLSSRRVLRVIVGKGLHSSGGEASLPRVVKGFLLERGYRFTPLAGVVEVQLRRQYAIKHPTTAAASLLPLARPGSAAAGVPSSAPAGVRPGSLG